MGSAAAVCAAAAMPPGTKPAGVVLVIPPTFGHTSMGLTTNKTLSRLASNHPLTSHS